MTTSMVPLNQKGKHMVTIEAKLSQYLMYLDQTLLHWVYVDL